jgi:hypothetical protein
MPDIETFIERSDALVAILGIGRRFMPEVIDVHPWRGDVDLLLRSGVLLCAFLPPGTRHRGGRMAHRIFLIPATVAFLATISAQPAEADPLIVTGGGFETRFDLVSSVGLIGDGFQLGSLSPGAHLNVFDSCVTCAPGTVLDLSMVITGFATTDVPQIFNGVVYTGPMFFVTDLQFSAPMVTLPSSIQPVFAATFPFTFRGTLSAAREGRVTAGHVELTGPPLFSTTLVGEGTGRVSAWPASVIEIGSADQFAIVGVRYLFEEAAAPTPEPATLLLISCGAALIYGKRRPRAVRSSLRM